METEHGTAPKQRIDRLSQLALRRLEAWAFLKGVSPPGAFAARHIQGDIEAATAAAAEEDPLIGYLVDILDQRDLRRSTEELGAKDPQVSSY